MSHLFLYIGRARSDRTESMYRQILTDVQSGKHVIFIVPEQATFLAERKLATMSGTGLINVDVLSLERLCDQLLKGTSRTLPFLSEQGVAMTTRRIAEEQSDKLIAFGQAVHKQGFCKNLAGLFSSMKRAAISPDALREVSEKLEPGSLLKDKIQDLSLLYEGSNTYLASRYLTADDRLNAAIQLMKYSFVRDSHVYIQGCTEATGQYFALLEELLLTASSVTVGLLEDHLGADADLFEPSRRIRETLVSIAEKHSVPCTVCPFHKSQELSKPLLHLEKNLFSFPGSEYLGPCESIVLASASSRQREAELACDAVLNAVRNGLRYRDIVILMSDPASYRLALKRSLELRKVPYFLDSTKSVLSHPAAELILDSLSSIVNNFHSQDLLSISKNPFSNIPRENAEAFENYVLRYGIRGSLFFKPFQRGSQHTQAEHARQVLMKPLLNLRDGLHARTVQKKLTALYEYLVDIHLPEQLKEKSTLLISQDMPREASEYAELWSHITSLLDQLYVILGDTPMSREDFLTLVEEGFSSITLGVIPDTADRVLLGDISRTVLPDSTKMLLVIGANDGLLPANRFDDSIIDTAELNLLRANGLSVWNSNENLQKEDLLHLYSLFCVPTKLLYVSFSYTSESGELLPAPLYEKLKTIFPSAKTIHDSEEDFLPVCERTGLRTLADAIREHPESSVCKDLFRYYTSKEEYHELLSSLRRTASDGILPENLQPDTADALYRNLSTMNASRLEHFNLCPMQHFLKYGLDAKKRKEFREERTDAGTFYHAMFESFLRYCKEHGLDLSGLSDADANTILDAVSDEVVRSHHDAILIDNPRVHAVLFLSLATVRKSILAMVHQMRSGTFEPLGAEIHFGDDCTFPAIPLDLGNGRIVKLTGIIDRVDKASLPGTDYYRVIDYKTSGRSMDYGAILEGLNLQLPLYLRAATALSGFPAGMYYMPVEVDPVEDGKEIEEILQKNFQLRGVTVRDPKIVECTEQDFENNSSVLSGVKKNKDGELTGAVCGSTEMTHMLEQSLHTAEKTGRNVLGGQVRGNPYEGTCKWCDYRSICLFDQRFPDCRVKKKQSIRKEEFFEKITRMEHTNDAD